MARLVVRPEAEIDLLEAALWYEGERVGLGDRFLEAVKATFQGIEERPLSFPSVAQSIRRALISKFPYAVFFTLDDNASTVIAVLHQHRNPAEWQRRE